ncbi:MAG: zf-HC2 domain-containing protein [Deltaproteobacteria bacterium]
MAGKPDELIRSVYREWKKGREPGLHPDEETFVLFIDGKLSSEEALKLKQHILSCPECGCLARCHLVSQPPAESPSEPLMEKARTLIAQRLGKHAMELVLESKEQLLHILEVSGDVLVGQEFVPAAVFRSRQTAGFRDAVTVIKDLERVRVELKVEKKEKTFAVTVTAREKENQGTPGDLRVSLLKGGVELESYVPEAGQAVFGHILPGRYMIHLTSSSDDLAALFLEIRG